MKQPTKTTHLPPSRIQRAWHLIDLRGQVLGRVATKIAGLLSGQHKVARSPHLDVGDYVVALNCNELVLTGRKAEQKLYFRHSGYPGGFKSRLAKTQLKLDSRQVLIHAVRGMLPKNKLLSSRLRRLKAYPNNEHPHSHRFPTQKKV